VAALAAVADRGAAQALLASTTWLDLPPARRQALQATVSKLDATAAAKPSTARGNGATPLLAVTRAEYARFAQATGRKPADCGRSGLFGPRLQWSKVGSDGAPVTCVSAADAEAYAAWRGAREHRRYRLPTAGELRPAPATPVSAWSTLCADAGCRRRHVSGKPRALAADRGYTDVGIRLARRG
jgi:hypothetical protein